MENESRKRPYVGDEDNLQTKKRAIANQNGSPPVNGGAFEMFESIDPENLELFRKEAIFRRMKHYSREHERSQIRIEELERRKSTCEAGLAAMTACWTQLVDAIRLVVRTENLPPVDVKTRDLFDMTAYVSGNLQPDLASALKDNMEATQTLLTKFIQLNGQTMSPLLHEEVYLSCQRAQTECIALRSEVDVMRAKLLDSVAERDSLHTALVAAQTLADRLQSETVLAIQTAAYKHAKKEEEPEEPERKLPSSPEPSHANGNKHDPPDLEEWQEVIKAKENRIVGLEQENAKLRDEINLITIELKAPSPQFIISTPQYHLLLSHTSKLEHNVTDDREELRRLREQVDQLRQTRKEFEDGVINSAGQANQELKASLARRDTENLRLRDQRDQQASELHERKHKDSAKMASLHELKALAESRAERISVLQSEITRCKTHLAANANNEDLMAFFLRGHTEDTSYVEDLKNRLTAAETRVHALEQSLRDLGDGNPDAAKHMSNEAKIRQELAEVTKKLERYQSLYGSTSALAPDVQHLSNQLQQKEEEIQKLRASETQRIQAESSLYSELDKLSTAWEALDRQVKGKVFDLMNVEERLVKSSHEKAKSDNKFFAAMRDKEAIDAERKNITRNLEKQAKVIEKLADSEKNLLAQVADLEREIAVVRDIADFHKNKAESCERESQDWRQRMDNEHTRCVEYRTMWQDREKWHAQKGAELRKAEEGFLRSKKDLDRQLSKLKGAGSGSASQKEEALEEEIKRCYRAINCTTCGSSPRNTIITKCMHTFCRQCVDTRISVRQRKCPACNLPFALSDVQQVFLQ